MEQSSALTITQTISILKQIGQNPRKSLGQNFLIDPNIVNKSISLAKVEENQTIVEVGPGIGTLSKQILQKGAKLFAVELDKKLHAYLLEEIKTDKFNILLADALDKPLGNFQELNDFKICANLPYAISTPWLDLVLENDNLPLSMTLMLQKEAANRFAAKNGKDFCPISIFLNSAFDFILAHEVSANCFYPRPNVSSKLVHFEKKQNPLIFAKEKKYAIRAIFNKRRKMLSGIVKNLSKEFDFLEDWLIQIEKMKLAKPNLRPEALDIKAWQELENLK